MPSAICWSFVSMQRGLQYSLKYTTHCNKNVINIIIKNYQAYQNILLHIRLKCGRMGFFITCRGCWLNGDWWRFYYRQNCSLKRLDDDGLSLKGGSSMRDGHRGNERFRLNGNLGAKLNGPLRCLEKLCCVNKCVILLQIEEEWFKEGN